MSWIALIRGHLRERPDIEQIQYLVQIKAELSNLQITFVVIIRRICLTRTKKDKTSPDRKSLNLNRLKRLLSHVQILVQNPLKDTVILKRSQKYTCNGQKVNLEQIWSLYFSWESWKQSLKQQKSSQSDWIKLRKFLLLSWILLPNELNRPPWPSALPWLSGHHDSPGYFRCNTFLNPLLIFVIILWIHENVPFELDISRTNWEKISDKLIWHLKFSIWIFDFFHFSNMKIVPGRNFEKFGNDQQSWENENLRVVQTKAILFLKSMSERGGSDIERRWIWMMNF